MTVALKKTDMKILASVYIGFDALNYIVHHDSFKDIPKILETPYVGEDKENKNRHISLKLKC